MACDDDCAARFADVLRQIEEQPSRFDLFHALRLVDALHRRQPKLGRARLPQQETLRLGQEPSLSFAPATLAAYRRRGARPGRLKLLSFGLFGPNGPLPLHLTEYARERLYHGGDATLADFADLFHHRLIALFYRAWADAQPVVSLDRPDDDRYSAYIASLCNLGQPGLRRRDSVPDHAKLYNVAHLVRPSRNPEGLLHALSHYFGAPVELAEFQGSWLKLDPGQLTTLGRREPHARLGAGAILGCSVWDRQSRFRLRIGPLPLPAYQSFLPDRPQHRALIDWVRNYTGFEFGWDVVLVLSRPAVPACLLGGVQQLGWTTWLGRYRRPADAADLCLNPEPRLAAAPAARAAASRPSTPLLMEHP